MTTDQLLKAAALGRQIDALAAELKQIERGVVHTNAAHEDLHRRGNRHRAEPERPGKRYLSFEYRYVAHGETKRHGYRTSIQRARALRLGHASLTQFFSGRN